MFVVAFQAPRGGRGADVLTLDIELNRVLDGAADISRNPVEVGGDVADHFDRKPVKLSFGGLILDDPFDPQAAIARSNVGGRDGGAARGLDNPLERIVSDPTAQPDFTRSAAAVDRLRSAFERDEVFFVSSDTDAFENMALTSWSATPRGDQAWEISGTLEPVRFAYSREVEGGPSTPESPKATRQGRTSTAPATQAETARGRSLASEIFGRGAPL